MAGFRDKLERIFAAVAFAERGEHSTALDIAGEPPGAHRSTIDDLMVAVTFAEAGCRDMALEVLEPAAPRAPRRVSGFAAAVGLAGVRMRYGVASV